MTHSRFLSRLTSPSIEDIEVLAADALKELPSIFGSSIAPVAIVVEDLADDATLEEMGIDDPFSLTGLYRGVPLPAKSVLDSAATPDLIVLFRRAILDEWAERQVTLGDLVREVVIHEVGHHFGFSDGQMEGFED